MSLYVLVEWEESCIEDGVAQEGTFPQPAKLWSSGVVVMDNEFQMTIARDYLGNGVYRSLVSIPRRSVICATLLAKEPSPRVVVEEGGHMR